MLDWLPENVSTFGRDIDALFYLVYYITTVVFVLVIGAMILFLVMYRSRPGHRAVYSQGHTKLEWVWTVVTFLVVITLAAVSYPTWVLIKERRPPASTEGVQIRVIGKQFNWIFIYPGPDRQFDTDDDLQMENALYAPVDRVVWLTLRSEDVIHGFFIPQFRLKQDAVPGRSIPAWFQATRPGIYEIACAEICGFGHGTMRGQAHVLAPEAYDAWVQEQWPSETDEVKE